MNNWYEKALKDLTYEDKKSMLKDFAKAILELRVISKVHDVDLFLFHAQAIIHTFSIVLLNDEREDECERLVNSLINLPEA